MLPSGQLDPKLWALKGLRIARAWKGYGSAIGLELGLLTEWTSPRGHVHKVGQASLFVEWDWRVEDQAGIVFGSSEGGPLLTRRIPELNGRVIERIEVAGQVPELRVTLTGGWTLQTMAMVAGDPQWSLRTLEGAFLHVRTGRLTTETEPAETSPFEIAELERAEHTAKRWLMQQREARAQQCEDCRAFVRLDGQGALLDFGCCSSARSPFDGRVVHRAAGCEAFDPGE